MTLRASACWGLLLGLSLLLLLPSHAHGGSDYSWTRGEAWSVGGGQPKDTPAEQLRYAYELEKKGEWIEAARQYFLVLDNYGHTTEAGTALQRLAKCLFEMESYYQSFQALEQVLKDFPTTIRKRDLIKIEYRIGKQLQKGQSSSLFGNEDDAARQRALTLSRAIEVFDAVLDHDPIGPDAPKAYLAKGDCLVELKKYDEAVLAYEQIIKNFPDSEQIMSARFGIQEAKTHLGTGNPTELDMIQEELRRAQAAGTVPVDDGSRSIAQRASALDEAQAKKMWDAALFYDQRGTAAHKKAAVFTLEELIRRYNNTTYAELARRRLGKIVVPKEDRFNLDKFTFNPFSKKKKEPTFVAPPPSTDYVQTRDVYDPIKNDAPTATGTTAGINPAAPPRTLAPIPTTPHPTTSRGTSARPMLRGSQTPPATLSASPQPQGRRTAPESPSRPTPSAVQPLTTLTSTPSSSSRLPSDPVDVIDLGSGPATTTPRGRGTRATRTAPRTVPIRPVTPNPASPPPPPAIPDQRPGTGNDGEWHFSEDFE